MITIIIAILVAIVVYIGVGYVIGRRTKTIEDMLPLSEGSKAHVENAREFSASTVATTISLATVVIAFFELAPYLGLWLFWCVITTSLGLIVVRAFAGCIWKKLQHYNYRPTLHEFLGTEYDSQLLRLISAICVSLGLVGAFAVELTVGSRFLAWLVPSIPSWVVVCILSLVAFFYTASGGFRAVIVTDRIQMISIWLLLTILPIFYVIHIVNNGGWSDNIVKIPQGVLSLSYRDGLTAFILGIFVINVPTFISDMTIWQRVAGTQKEKTLVGGLWFSVASSAITWAIIALLACFALIFQLSGNEGVNPLVGVLKALTNSDTFFSKIVLFLAVIGLYGAMLSTASTQLIAVSHTIYEDIVSKLRNKDITIRLHDKKELRLSRAILISAAVCSTVLVEVLSKVGFSIADLVFAIYGAQLGLSPLVILALIIKRDNLHKLRVWSTIAVALGFTMGWSTAIYGRISGNTDIVWLSPVSSLIISTIIVVFGLIFSKQRTRREDENKECYEIIVKAKEKGLLNLQKAEGNIRLKCLADKCSLCCRYLGMPFVEEDEMSEIGDENIVKIYDRCFVKSDNGICSLLKEGLCSKYNDRPSGCREYPWYNIDGELYYDAGCPGIKNDYDDKPDVKMIGPMKRFASSYESFFKIKEE